MLTAKQLAAQRRQTEAELRRDLKQKDRERLANMRAAIAAAKAAKKEHLVSVRSMCRAERDRIKERGKQLREELRQQLASERIAARGSCSLNRERARETGKKTVEQTLAEFLKARSDAKRERLWDRAFNPLSGKADARKKLSAREVRHESDDEVRANIPPELTHVFERVKRGIHDSPRRSRTEAFLEWVHDHPESVFEMLEVQQAADLKRLEREEARFARELREGRRYKRNAGQLAAALSAHASHALHTEVPF